MSKQAIQAAIEEIRNQTVQYGNTRMKVADLLTLINNEKLNREEVEAMFANTMSQAPAFFEWLESGEATIRIDDDVPVAMPEPTDYMIYADPDGDLKKSPMAHIYELVSGSQSLGTITPTSTIPAEGNVWGFAGEGTYPNAGNITVEAGKFAILSRVGTTWSNVEIEIPNVNLSDIVAKNLESQVYNFSEDGAVAVGDFDYYYGDKRFFIEASTETKYLSVFALKDATIQIVLVNESNGEINNNFTLTESVKKGWNTFSIGRKSTDSLSTKHYVMIKVFESGVLAFKGMNTNLGIQMYQSVISPSSAVIMMNLESYDWTEFLHKNYFDFDKEIVFPDPIFFPNSNSIKPTQTQGLGTGWAYSNQSFWVSSAERLKGVNVFCLKEGAVWIDFYKIIGYDVEYLNPNNTNKFELKLGWNYIDESDIDIPFFDDLAYVGLRSEVDVIGYNENGLQKVNNQSLEINFVAKTMTFSQYMMSFNIIKYRYDIEKELEKRVVELPKGQINITNSISVSNKKIIGKGIGVTLLKDKRQSGCNFLEIGDFCEVSDFSINGANMNLNKSSNYFNDLASIRANTGVECDNGVCIIGLGVRVERLNIENFGGRGLIVSGQTTRLIHSFISSVSCYKNFIGFEFTSSGEYCTIFGLVASNNVLGIKITAGNTFISSGTFNDNRIGLYMNKAGNDSHGCFSASQFNHSGIYSMVIDQISHGHSFVGCHVFEGDIYLINSIGFNFTGGTIDANIYAEGGKTQRVSFTSFQNAYWDRTQGIRHNYNSSISHLKMTGNFFMFETGENDHIINNI